MDGYLGYLDIGCWPQNDHPAKSSFRMPSCSAAGETESGFSFSLAGSDGVPTFNVTPSPVNSTPPPVNGLAGGFAEGSTVTFHGLKSSSKHNGAQGRLVKFHADKEHLQVQLHKGDRSAGIVAIYNLPTMLPNLLCLTQICLCQKLFYTDDKL